MELPRYASVIAPVIDSPVLRHYDSWNGAIKIPPPLAYFLTWTCHGTWLHGDDRGSVDRAHNAPGTPLIPPDAQRRDREKRSLLHIPNVLNDEARRTVQESIADHCHLRGWELRAINVRTNHVHVVVSCPGDVPPERVMTEFKLWATRRLRVGRLIPPHGRPWTRHGSTRWINNQQSLDAAVAYVVEGQDGGS